MSLGHIVLFQQVQFSFFILGSYAAFGGGGGGGGGGGEGGFVIFVSNDRSLC